jgi:DNA-binding MarR family transcriptional regulator
LVRSGLVARRGADHDRRVMMAVLTDLGRTVLEQAAPHHVASVRRHLIDLLSAGELEALASGFGAIRAHLDHVRHETPAREAS